MKNLKVFESFDDEVNEANGQKGLLVFVYRSADGQVTTNQGLTSKVKNVVLVGEGVDGPSNVDGKEDYLVLQKKNVKGEYLYAVPKSLIDSKEWTMFGGNFVYSSDSRFNAISKYPIPVHDRVEKNIMDK